MTVPATTSEKRCPNCHAVVPSGSSRCVSCKLEVAQMANFAAAKKAALKKGLRTDIEEARRNWRPFLLRVFLAMLILLPVGLVSYYMMTRPEPWEKFPTSRVAAAEKLMGLIATDNDKSLDEALPCWARKSARA